MPPESQNRLVAAPAQYSRARERQHGTTRNRKAGSQTVPKNRLTLSQITFRQQSPSGDRHLDKTKRKSVSQAKLMTTKIRSALITRQKYDEPLSEKKSSGIEGSQQKPLSQSSGPEVKKQHCAQSTTVEHNLGL